MESDNEWCWVEVTKTTKMHFLLTVLMDRVLNMLPGKNPCGSSDKLP